MIDRAPAYRDPALHFDALRLVALKTLKIHSFFDPEGQFIPVGADALGHPTRARMGLWVSAIAR